MRYIGMILLIWFVISGCGQKVANVPPKQNLNKGVNVSELRVPEIKHYVYSPKNARDPFVPLLSQVDTELAEGFLSSLKLKGILVSEERTLKLEEVGG